MTLQNYLSAMKQLCIGRGQLSKGFRPEITSGKIIVARAPADRRESKRRLSAAVLGIPLDDLSALNPRNHALGKRAGSLSRSNK